MEKRQENGACLALLFFYEIEITDVSDNLIKNEADLTVFREDIRVRNMNIRLVHFWDLNKPGDDIFKSPIVKFRY